MRRYGGLVRTYFSNEELGELRYAYRPRLDFIDVEFYSYLRLAAILASAQRLPDILRRITLAPSHVQERELAWSRGGLSGRLDVPSYLRSWRANGSTRGYPGWRVHASFVTPENMLAAEAAQGVVAELQTLSSRLPLTGRSEGALVVRIVDALERFLREPALGEALARAPRGVLGEAGERLLERVAERWRTRRISNTAYAELWRWVAKYRKVGLMPGDEAELHGVAYSEGFDNRLYELFCLGWIRDGLRGLGFSELEARPVHESTTRPVLEVQHPSTGLRMCAYFQRGDRVFWTESLPREWPEIRGIADIALVPETTTHPVIVIDAKNRHRGNQLEEPLSDELYKMLGYFENFSRRVRVAGRGPVGALLFVSRSGLTGPRTFSSRGGGYLVAMALDPLSDESVSTAPSFVEDLFAHAGLAGGQTHVSSALHEIKAANISEEEIVERIHELTIAEYCRPGAAYDEAVRDLELHLLGDAWGRLTDDAQRFIATAEVFWGEHRFALGIDFAPVVVELARAMESLLSKWLFERVTVTPASGTKDRLMLGQMRAQLEMVRQGVTNPPVAALRAELDRMSATVYAVDELEPELGFVNVLRRQAAHKDTISGTEAGQLRNRLLGVGASPAVLVGLIERFAPQ